MRSSYTQISTKLVQKFCNIFFYFPPLQKRVLSIGNLFSIKYKQRSANFYTVFKKKILIAIHIFFIHHTFVTIHIGLVMWKTVENNSWTTITTKQDVKNYSSSEFSNSNIRQSIISLWRDSFKNIILTQLAQKEHKGCIFK